MDRRNFVFNGSLMTAASIGGTSFFKKLIFSADSRFVSMRPPLGKRTFTSPAVESVIETVKRSIADKELAWMFDNCYPNTLDTTVDYELIAGKPDTFIKKGSTVKRIFFECIRRLLVIE
ncbi:MAG: glycoside hydrolase family 125 protein, partial [Saprospiraceae bacterium]|nr:glycoside hydrolase family 125 protein [Saprospiraceae bacterium]